MLNQEQLDTILSKFPRGLYKSVSEEMLDHFASAIEHKMLGGMPFHLALNEMMKEFPEVEVNNIQKQQQKMRRIGFFKRTSPIAAGLCLLAVFTINQVQSHNPWRLPIALDKTVKMASGFGYRIHPINKIKKLHKGMDFTAQLGTPVRPVLDGEVIKVRSQTKGYGNHIEVRHNDSLVTRYAQLHEMKVAVGDRVQQNQIIGTVGSSGTSTGPHLHFEVIVHGKQVNPVRLDAVFGSLEE